MLHVQPLDAEHALHEAPEFAGHDVHMDTAFAPAVVEYVLAGQSLHVAVPVVLVYFPAAHGAHAVAPVVALNVPTAHGEHEYVMTPPPPPGHTCPHEAQQSLHVPKSV